MYTKKIMAAIGLTLLLAFTACSGNSAFDPETPPAGNLTNDPPTGNPTNQLGTATNPYTYDDGAKTYKLVITSAARAAVNDDYVLTITVKDTKVTTISVGTVKSIAKDVYTLISEGSSFTVTITSNKIVNIDGTIPETGFNSVPAFAAFLAKVPANTAATPYTVKLNVNSFGGDSSTTGSVGYVLNNNRTKYVNLDLSGSTITYIGNSDFGYFDNLTGITIPNSVTGIGDFAFAWCDNLTGALTIPSSVIDIGYCAFDECTSLTAINVDSANTVYSSQDGVLYNKGKTGLIQYPAGKTGSTFTIPSSVTSIGESAFGGCTGLTGVTIPDNVTSIGYLAFSNCRSLTGITIGNGVTSIGSAAFLSCKSLTSVTFKATIPTSGLININIIDEYHGAALYGLGDLVFKYDGKGTYTTTAPVSDYSVWVKI